VIEKRLQDDAFWYFISNKTTETNRIEFVLSLAARNLDGEGIIDSDKLKVFLQFNRLLSEKSADVVQEWLKIKQCYMTLEEWFNDRALFHVIGYLVSQDVAIDTLFDLSQTSKTKYTFRQSLINLVLKKSFGYQELNALPENWIDEALSTLTYDSGSKRLRSILLLFNIASLLSNPATNARFQFDKYKGDLWDIEHIRSVASEMPVQKEKQKAWLDNVISYISEDASFDIEGKKTEDNSKEQAIKKDAITLMDSTSFDNDQFEAIYMRVISHYDPRGDEDVDNSIGNLTLLDSSTNRSYKNAVFPIKRARIITLDKEATFVPLCTKNAFLKYYSKQVDKMLYWEPRDSQDHQRAMSEIILGFFCGKGVHQ